MKAARIWRDAVAVANDRAVDLEVMIRDHGGICSIDCDTLRHLHDTVLYIDGLYGLRSQIYEELKTKRANGHGKEADV